MSQQDYLALVTTILPEASAGRVAHILDAPGNNSFFNHLFVQINAVAVHIYMARSYIDSDKKKQTTLIRPSGHYSSNMIR